MHVRKKILIFVFVSFFLSSCASLKGSDPLLSNDKKTQFIEANKSISSCLFLQNKVFDGSINRNQIIDCISSSHTIDLNIQNKSIDKETNKFKFLDDYLGTRLMPYILVLTKKEQADILKYIAISNADNFKFIRALVNRGIPTQDILLQTINDGSENPLCEVTTFFLKKNIQFYKRDKWLNESKQQRIDFDKTLHPIYRKSDLHYLTDTLIRSDTCFGAIELLVSTNPNLRDLVIDKYYNSTPLNLYMVGFIDRYKKDISIAKQLITQTNVNRRDNYGNTPLHSLLINGSSTRRDPTLVRVFLQKGANIDIKNKNGITARELIIKRPDLKSLLKRDKT